jgi:hypothetical protein
MLASIDAAISVGVLRFLLNGLTCRQQRIEGSTYADIEDVQSCCLHTNCSIAMQKQLHLILMRS